VRPSKPEIPSGEDEGSPVEPDSAEDPVSADPAADQAHCKRRALDLLARREHSRVELERKLGARGFAEEAIAPALDDLERSGALAGARFTDAFIRSRAARGQGPVRIRAELAARGIDDEQAAASMADAGVDWAEAAGAVRRKRFGAEVPRDFKERARQARFLEYRGFERGQIDGALKGREEETD
jgi:regulatory protein